MRRVSASVLCLLSLGLTPFPVLAISGDASSQPSRTQQPLAKRLHPKKKTPLKKVAKKSASSSSTTAKPVYLPYTPAVLTRPGKVVIFFYSRSCGAGCKMRDADLRNWYKIEDFGWSTYVVREGEPDYAKLAKALRMSGYFDSFMKTQIATDGSVMFISGIVHPDDEKLMGFLR